jgi:aminocarboxymuconate-semialdehyde decarboxylase
MHSRREFLRIAAAAATGIFATGFSIPGAQRGPAARRQVSIGNRRIKVIDIHGHFLIPEEADIVRNTNLAANILNQLSGPLVLGPARLQAMDQQGVDVQALTHQGGWWYGTDRETARRLIRIQNEGLAKWCAMHPDRFVALASVALQHPDLAAEQLEEAMKMGMRGVGIAGHVDGEVPASPKYDPFWAKAQELGAFVFVHPAGGAENVVARGALGGRGDLANIIGNPLETTVFLTRLIFEGTLDRFPRLKICGAHAGGYLPSYLGRTDVACDVRPGANCVNKKRPREYFKDQLMVDSMIFSEEGLRHLIAEVGAGQVVYGTDMPYNWPVTVDLILNSSFLSNADKEAILGGTLAKLLRVS